MNLVILIGNVGQAPEMRFTAAGVAVTNIRLATHKSFKDKKTGARKETTEWHRVVIFGAQAEVANKGLVKGSLCSITGENKTRKWIHRDGSPRYTTEVN